VFFFLFFPGLGQKEPMSLNKLPGRIW